jgi:hypothetical protein
MFSAISATRFAMRLAMMPYGEACCWAPFAVFFTACADLAVALVAGFFVREAAVFCDVR